MSVFVIVSLRRLRYSELLRFFLSGVPFGGMANLFAALIRHIQSITWRILIPMVLLTVVSNLLMTSVVMRQLNDQLLVSSQRDLIQESEVQSEQFKQHIDNLIKGVQFLRGLPVVEVIANYDNKKSLDDLTESEYFQRLKTVFLGAMRLRTESVQVRLIYRDGSELLRVDSYGERGDLRVVENSELQNKGDRDYFIETLKLGEGEVYLSNINLNREFGKIVRPLEAVIRAATPIYNKSGELFGIVVVNQSMLDSFAGLESIGDRDHRFYIADKQGEYVYHDDPKKAFKFEFEGSANIRADFPVVESLFMSPGENLSVGYSDGVAPQVYALKSIRYNPYNP
ncbi:MAG: cache domain-containing protein, partial [Spongiibacteraceae bacterium]